LLMAGPGTPGHRSGSGGLTWPKSITRWPFLCGRNLKISKIPSGLWASKACHEHVMEQKLVIISQHIQNSSLSDL
jgi:hypothetical protein